MEDPTSKLYTFVAFASMTTMVLSVLYRKKQTRIECNNPFWNQFWKYIITKQKYDESIDHIIINAEDDELFEINIASLTRIGIYNDIYQFITFHKPSHSVKAFISNIINNHFHKILNLKTMKSNSTEIILNGKNTQILHKYLEKHPLTIFVPLCGCSYDLLYISSLLQTKYKLSSNLFKIIGIDSSLAAIRNFFKQNNMIYAASIYNPKYMKHPDFYRIEVYSNKAHSINIMKNDIFKYFELSQHLQYVGIAETPCFIKQKSIDIIIDINGISCINPSDRKIYADSMKYWLKDNGSMLLNTYCYDPKLSNYPPFTIHPIHIRALFGSDKYKLLESTDCDDINDDSISHSWLIHK